MSCHLQRVLCLPPLPEHAALEALASNDLEPAAAVRERVPVRQGLFAAAGRHGRPLHPCSSTGCGTAARAADLDRGPGERLGLVESGLDRQHGFDSACLARAIDTDI